MRKKAAPKELQRWVTVERMVNDSGGQKTQFRYYQTKREAKLAAKKGVDLFKITFDYAGKT